MLQLIREDDPNTESVRVPHCSFCYILGPSMPMAKPSFDDSTTARVMVIIINIRIFLQMALLYCHSFLKVACGLCQETFNPLTVIHNL